MAAARPLTASFLGLSLLLAGCGGGDTGTSATTVVGGAAATSAGGAATTKAGDAGGATTTAGGAATTKAGDAGGLKKASAVKLPESVAGYTGKVQGEGGVQVAMYTKTGDQTNMLNATVNPGATAAVVATLKNPTKGKHVTCGELPGTSAVGCFIPLDGGVVNVTGTGKQPAAEMVTFSDALYEAM